MFLVGAMASLVMGQKKPNFSGVWKRTLGEELLTIEHREPKLRLTYWIKDAAGERTLDLTALTDGKEHRQTVLSYPAIVIMRWEGTGLFWEIQRETAFGKVHNRRTLKLAADGQSITAERVNLMPDGTAGSRLTETWLKTAPKSAAERQTEEELTKLVSEFESALLRNDGGVFERFFAPDWLYTTLEGQTVQGRAAIVAAFRSGALKVEAWKTENPQWQMYGDTVVSSALTYFKGKNNGQELDTRFRATSTFIKRDGRWQIVATQHTPILVTDNRQNEQELRQFVNELITACERNDVATLTRLYADEFIGTTLAGELYNKPALLDAIKSGVLKYESVKVDEIKIHVYGETAAIHSRGHLKLRLNGQAKEDFTRDTTTLVKRQGQWRIVADHASPFKP